MMPHHCAWNVEALPSGDPGAQSQLRVIGIRKKILVEPADFIQHRAPVHGRASVGPQDLFHAIVLPFIQLTAAAPAILAIGINQMACFVDPARILVHQNFRSRHPDVRPSVECARQASRSQSGSASASLLSSATNSVSDAAKPWLLAAQKPRFSRFRISLTSNLEESGTFSVLRQYHFGRTVVRSIVDNHHFKRLVQILSGK